VTAPIFGPDGSILLDTGYHPPSKTYFEPGGLRIPAIADAPGQADVQHAVRLIVDDLLGDFPFVAQAERAHAVALLLLPFVRSLIDGLTPLHLVEAPSPGTGKGLLVTACLMPA